MSPLLVALAFVSQTVQLPNVGLPPGTGVQRTMHRLATGEPVKIMFYGQSITVADWAKQVEVDLRKRFPKSRIEVRNMAISGFSANLLKRTAERDSLEFYPDLIILHTYGGEPDHEELIRVLRSSTTAEVLMQSDHIHGVQTGKPEDAEADRGFAWHDKHATWMRGIAEKYGCAYVDIRSSWYAEMAKKGAPFTAFVEKDKVHLNSAGNRLMADLVDAYLVEDQKLARPDPVKSFHPEWKDGKLEMDFTGNRVDVQIESGDSTVNVLIDGKRPLEISQLYLPSRASSALGVWFPALMKVDAIETPKLEKYTVSLSNFREDGHRFDFKASGSLTGEDGSGDSYVPFTSKSGRVKIDPADWTTNYGFVVSKQMPKDGFEVSWTYSANFLDRIARPGWYTVAQGLTNTTHHLTLTSFVPPKIGEIRVFTPLSVGP